MIFKTVTALALRSFVEQTLRNAPFIVGPPCQSDIKRTLRRRGRTRPKRQTPRLSAGFCASADGAFDPDGERRVSAPAGLWFRNGGCAGQLAAAGGDPHQSKIYAESNQSDFSRIFAELISMQTLAIYRRLLVRTDCARSTATGSRRTAGVARCFFCFAWHSGSGWCSCCCQETRRLNRKSCRGSGPPKPCPPPPRRCPT